MTSWSPYLVAGLTVGSIYALAGVGLTLTFKTSGIVNFAHGAVAALAAYLMAEFWEAHGLPWPLASLLVLMVVGVVGGGLLELMARVLATKSQGARVAATAGLMVGLQGAILAVFGAEQAPMSSFLPTGLVRVGGVNVRVEQLVIVAFAAASTIILSWWLARTRSGVATAGAVDDPELLALAGTNPATVRRGAWMIGTSFAAVSGMLLGPISGLNATVLTFIIFYAFGAATVGAFRSLPLTYAGGMAIGVGAALLDKMLGDTTNRAVLALPSTLPILVLFVGLMVTRKTRLADPGTEVVQATGRAPLGLALPTRAVLAAGGLLLLVAIPELAGSRTVIYSTALAYGILFLSLSLLVRLSGQISLCQMTFAAVGGVAFAKAVANGVPWPLAVLIGGLVAVPVGAMVAFPAIRLSGIYLAIGTFGFGLLVQRLVFPTGFMFGAAQRSLPAPRPEAGWLAGTETGYYYVVLTVAVLCGLVVVAVQRSRMGRLLRALGDAPLAVDSHGTNTNYTRLLAFAVSAFLAGIAGAVLGPVTQTVGAPQYDFSISLLLVAVVFMSGRFVIAAAAVAATLYTVIPGYITSLEVVKWLPVLFGTGAIIGAMLDGLPLVGRLRTTVDIREADLPWDPAEPAREEAAIASEAAT